MKKCNLGVHDNHLSTGFMGSKLRGQKVAVVHICNEGNDLGLLLDADVFGKQDSYFSMSILRKLAF